MLLSRLVLNVLLLGLVLSPRIAMCAPGTEEPQDHPILRTPPGHRPRSCSSVPSMPTSSPTSTVRTVYLSGLSLTRASWWPQLAGRALAAPLGQPSLTSAIEQPRSGIQRAGRRRLQHHCHPHRLSAASRTAHSAGERC
jgi:hypothetical protein